ncbi:MAG: NAD+ synthase [Pseudomonadota bacterium]
MKIALAQINPTVGAIEANCQLMLECAERLRAQQVDLIVFPELVLTGYPPEDLLLRPACQQRVDRAVQRLLTQISGITLVFGLPGIRNGQRYNLATAIRDGQVLAEYRKQYLPNYGVFDERRYFVTGDQTVTFCQAGIRFALAICEDIWHDPPIQTMAGADSLLSLHASPFHQGKAAEREARVQQLAQQHQLSVLYANQVGGQDELVFDGSSFVVANTGQLIARCPAFTSTELIITLDATGKPTSHTPLPPPPAPLATTYQALVCGTRDYVRKNHFQRVILGLSGGIDSALTLAIAVDALGADAVQAILLPSRYTAEISNQDAAEQARISGITYHSLPIETAVQAFQAILDPLFADLPADITEENIQARCRGLILMAISNKTGALLLTTGNKSELAVGYATLYGDMNGGFAPLKDVPKQLVYALTRWRNTSAPVIPQRVLERPPSAELRPDQQDSDSLPDYAVLDAIIERYVEQAVSVEQIIADGFEAETVQHITRLIDRNEYKRRQAAPGIKITRRAFGRERRYPITNGF